MMEQDHRPSDELKWILNIRRLLLDEELDENDEISVSIVTVPRTLSSIRFEAYTPQLVALGPYHCQRPELQDMERYKLSAAKRIQRQLQDLRFEHLVHEFVRKELHIRAYYHRYLDLNGETLAWMMAIDASFLLEFLRIHADVKDGFASLPSRMSHLMGFDGRRSAHAAILRDVMMVENQIPLFLLGKIIEEAQCFSSTKVAEDTLSRIVGGFIKDVCPFKVTPGSPHCITNILQHPHLLDLLYNLVTPENDVCVDIEDKTSPTNASDDPVERRSTGCLIHKIECLLIHPMASLFRYIRSVLISVCLKIITTLPVFMIFKLSLEHLLTSEGKSSDHQHAGPSQVIIAQPPLMEEIAIPSVTELINVGVKFSPMTGGLNTINFDMDTGAFQLPIINLDANTEVVLRNLVVYEVSVIARPWMLTRYTELMNGIIDTREDVILLRESGVVVNYMRSDGEVADMWNGMSRSIRMTRVPSLDRVVENVNKFYNSRWRVRLWRLFRRNGLDSWKIPTLFVVLLWIFVSLHSFCLFHNSSP